jgi:hypothetical protein
MSHSAHGSCCAGHRHDSYEIDPCMAQEIAQAEKERILYEKLKTQSDKFLMNLNIRNNRARFRGAVAQVEEDDPCSSSEDEESREVSQSSAKLVQILPSQFTTFHVQHKDSKIFLFCVPCDISPEFTKEKLDELYKAFVDGFPNPSTGASVVFGRFKSDLCVCGRCSETDSRPSGTLRSVAMILKRSPSVVLTRNGGLVGVWSAPPTDLSVSLHSFVSKHL